jgi:signal transduction histidine kinase
MTETSFRILEPWYDSWWFYLLCSLTSMLLVWLLVKWRTSALNRRKKALQQLVDVQTKDIEAQSRELERRLQQLQAQQVRLEENNQTRTRLIGIVSHDMMGPLKFLAFMGRKLRNDPGLSSEGQEAARFVVTVAEELDALSLNMLSWIRFHYASPEMKPEAFDLYQLVAEATEIPSTLAREKGLAFYNEVPTRLAVVQYKQALAVIVYNLTMNAMKYSTAGEIRVTARLDEDHVHLSIIDTGAGMEASMVERLNGMGLTGSGENVPAAKTQFGYVIIKDLLRMMGGGIKIESSLMKGTKVTVFFPVTD